MTLFGLSGKFTQIHCKVLEESFYEQMPFLTLTPFGWKPSLWCKHLLARQQGPHAYFNCGLYSPCRSAIIGHLQLLS